jgi:hypothetical protein
MINIFEEIGLYMLQKTPKNCSNHSFRAFLDTLNVLTQFFSIFYFLVIFLLNKPLGERVGGLLFPPKRGPVGPLNFDPVRPMVKKDTKKTQKNPHSVTHTRVS